MACSVEQVSPLLRPTLATPSLVMSTVLGSAKVAEGGAALMLAPLTAPRSRMLPLVSTSSATTLAIAASVLLGAGPVHGFPLQGFGLMAAAAVRFATVVPALQLLSISPGCPMASPLVPVSDLSST